MSGERQPGPSGSSLIVGFLAGIIAAGILFAVLPSGDSSAATGRVLKVAHTLPKQHPVHEGIEEMGRRLAALSDGRIRLEIFPNAQLGSETQALEKVQNGTLEIAKVSAAPLGNFVPAFQVFSLPYIFRNREHYWEVLDGAIGQDMLARLAEGGDGPTGFRGLVFYDAGSRSFYATEAIRRVKDLKGMKIRVMNDPVAMDMVQALGGAPAPIAYGELYSALQQGVVDGAENNPPSFRTSRHYEVCKHYTLDRHSRIPDVLVISQKLWEELDASERSWIEEAARASSRFQRKRWQEASERSLEALREAGVTVHEIDTEPFFKATASVRRELAEGPHGEVLDRILDQ